VYGLLKGAPSDAPLAGCYWRLRNPPDSAAEAPQDVGSGLMWVSPVLPMRGCDAVHALEVAAPIFRKHGFDPLVTFTLINERSIIGIMNVAFDRNHPGETELAHTCYLELFDALMAAGYPPYRVGLNGMHRIWKPEDTFWEVCQALKRAVDPADIISRGRYIPPLDAE
jgi:4-cresol dehydrogenase (hydroxylating) flavoprotein subunit